MADKMKKCDICGKDHAVGAECESCGWNEADERSKAKARVIRARYEKEANEPPKRKGIFE
jgi:hypothetical protein